MGGSNKRVEGGRGRVGEDDVRGWVRQGGRERGRVREVKDGERGQNRARVGENGRGGGKKVSKISASACVQYVSDCPTDPPPPPPHSVWQHQSTDSSQVRV